MKQLLTCTLLLAAACGGSGGTEMVADFVLPDVNINSTTAGQNISPRNYLGFVSAYYFGAAT